MSRPSLPALRRIGAAAVAAAGVGLVAASVSGMASLDRTLAAEAERANTPVTRAVSVERRWGDDCRERRRPQRSRPAWY